MTPPPWEVLADLLLQREALLCRLGEGVPPRELAGWFVTTEDVDRLLRSLPGLDGPPADVAGPLRQQLDAAVSLARTAFVGSLGDASLFSRLVRGADLDVGEAELLGLLAAVEVDPQRQRLLGYVQDNVQLPQPTLATLDRIYRNGTGGARLVAPDRALCRAALVEIGDSGPWAVRMCALPTRVIWYLRGDLAPDRGLPPDARRIPGVGVGVGVGGCTTAVLLVHGADRQSRLRALQAHWTGDVLLTPVPADGGWPAVVREATLTGSAVVVELEGGLSAEGRRALERAPHLRWALSSTAELPIEGLPQVSWSEIAVHDGLAGPEDWHAALGECGGQGYRLDREQLRLVATSMTGSSADLARGVRRLAAGHLDRLALRVTPSRTWDDLALPPDQKQNLAELAARYRRRGVVHTEWGFPAQPSGGVVAMFAGASGTGKTLAAEVIAGDLGLDLYKVDLAAVVSKYIGETEKNLGRIFDAAGAGDLVLFFDEADALFGKRTEVSDARDRYANLEVSYLLQRLERYPGLVILATNLQRNIDQAFLRRIAVAVDFPLPDETRRRVIWRQSFPPSAPTHDLDLGFLARNFKVSGGVIHNASLAAAFLAADDGQVITMEHLALALKREFQKLGRLRTETEFDRYYELVSRDDDVASAG